jgi:hypothetical protein
MLCDNRCPSLQQTHRTIKPLPNLLMSSIYIAVPNLVVELHCQQLVDLPAFHFRITQSSSNGLLGYIGVALTLDFVTWSSCIGLGQSNNVSILTL